MRKSSTVKNGGVKVNTKEMQRLLDVLQPNIKSIIKEGVDKYIGDGTRFMLELLMQAESQELCGRWNSRQTGRKVVRWGSESKATAVVHGAKRQLTRPRVRAYRNPESTAGEIQLRTYEVMNRSELMDGPLMAAILSGVSTRNYEKILSRGLEAKGVKSSSISRKAIAATKPTVEQFRKQSLQQHDLVVLLFDGIQVGKKQVICAMGIDLFGRKHVLGIRVGSTEHEIVCRDLVRDLIERGLSSSKQYLFVVDGSKALSAALRASFGQDIAIQRCQEHKIRDVQAYLPVKLRAELRDKMQAAYNQRTEKQALSRLTAIRSQLSLFSESAVNSITEGMLETVTLHRLGITGLLRKSLRTTNIIESAFAAVRRYMGRVSVYEDDSQRELWLTRSLLEAERHFRPLRGCRQIRKLRTELELRKESMSAPKPF